MVMIFRFLLQFVLPRTTIVGGTFFFEGSRSVDETQKCAQQSGNAGEKDYTNVLCFVKERYPPENSKGELYCLANILREARMLRTVSKEIKNMTEKQATPLLKLITKKSVGSDLHYSVLADLIYSFLMRNDWACDVFDHGDLAKAVNIQSGDSSESDILRGLELIQKLATSKCTRWGNIDIYQCCTSHLDDRRRRVRNKAKTILSLGADYIIDSDTKNHWKRCSI